MRTRRASLMIAAMMVAITAGTPVLAAPPSSGLEAAGRQVSDAELSEQRGKFIGPSNISYFGVQMQTSWQGADGITTNATLLFSVNFLNGAGKLEGATPVLMVAWNREGDKSMDLAGFGSAAAGSYVAIPQLPVGGLGSMQGAVQTQQIAGSDNGVRNDLKIAIVPASAIQPGSTTGLTPISSGETHQFADGDTLQFIVSNNQIGLAMSQGGSSDQVRQGLDGTAGQLSQHVLLNSSGNMVLNGMGVMVGVNQLEQAARLSVDNAISSMKGAGF